MSKIGYVRVSTAEQNTMRQEVLMSELGVDKVFMEKISGKNIERPQLKAMLDYIREGDIVIVESISRFARSAKDFLNLIDELDKKQVKFQSQKETIDTDNEYGRFMLTVFAAISQLERESIKQRQTEGIAIAKENGKYKGRKRIPTDEESFRSDYVRWQNKEITSNYIMKKFGFTAPTFWRRVKEYEDKHGITREKKHVNPAAKTSQQ